MQSLGICSDLVLIGWLYCVIEIKDKKEFFDGSAVDNSARFFGTLAVWTLKVDVRM